MTEKTVGGSGTEIRLIAFDLDGTLLDDTKRVPPENLRALERAAARGVWIVPATGRIMAGLPEQLRGLPFLRYFITANGSYLYDAAEERCIGRADVPLEQALDFYRYADTLDAPLYDCYQDNWGYMTAGMRDRVLAAVSDPGVHRLVETLRTPVPELKAFLAGRGLGVQKMQLYFDDPALRLRLLEELPARFPALQFSTSMPFNIEINARDATKGCALKKLCAHLGLALSQTMALGDGTNDLDMIQSAGVGVAMANAAPAVLAAADCVTGSNNDAGFAHAIEKFVAAL